MILVITGTHEQPFERLVQASDAYQAAHPDDRVVIQYGSARPPVHANGTPFLDRDELAAMMDSASVVVTHGGPGTILEAVSAGKLPIVAPRSARHGEHVDDHQIRFTEHLARHGRIVPLFEPERLGEAIAEASQHSTGDPAWRSDVHANRRRLADELDAWLLPGS